MNQYLRKWKIEIDGKPYLESQHEGNLRVVFDIDVAVMNAVSTADIRIYNLKTNTGIQQGSTIRLHAGYENNCDVIYSGVVTNIFKERQGADIATRLLCRNGAALVNNQRGTATAPPYGAGVRVTEIIKDLAAQWPLALEMDEDQFKDDPPMSSGYTANGDIPQILDALARQYKFSWTQELGALVVTKDDAERKTQVFDVNLQTGMVGIPEVTRGPSGMGVYVTTRINPAIRVNSRINITARFSTFNTGDQKWVENNPDLSANGEYNVFTMKYEGDTHGDAWNLSIDGMRPGTAPVPVNIEGGALVWGKRVTEEFRNKVRAIAKEQGLDPNWYMSIMAFETGYSFSASQRNNGGGSARGLIQFMPDVAVELGTTSQQLVLMTEVEQLDYVKKYFARYRSQIRAFPDMYMAVLWPKAMTAPLDYVLWERGTATNRQYQANSGLDINGDGKITKAEAFSRIQKVFEEGKKEAA